MKNNNSGMSFDEQLREHRKQFTEKYERSERVKQYTRSSGIGNEFGNRNFDEGYTSRDRSRDHLNKLFVGNIANTTDEMELKQFVEGFGYEVTQVDLRVDPQTNRRRGFGFVKLGGAMDEQMLRIAAEEMNGKSLGGRELTFGLARPKT